MWLIGSVAEMTAMTEPAVKFSPWLRRPMLIEWLVIVAITCVLVALIVPGAKWASSGDITIPVQVQVFDPISAKPVVGARVGISRFRWWFDQADIVNSQNLLADVQAHATDEAGSVVIDHKFSTGANHERPVTHAHLPGAWVIVEADGYGRVLVPVNNTSFPSGELRKRGKLVVPIGLCPLPRNKG
jgi:hypothetical protein